MAVKKRNPFFVILATIFTLFIYGLYWFYSTRKELDFLVPKRFSPYSLLTPILCTLGLLIPIVNLYILWKYSEDLEIATTKAHSKVEYFVSWLVFPVALYLAQTELNKLAK